MRNGSLLGIAGKRSKRADMVTVDETHITVRDGLTGDWRGRPGPRQVTVLTREAWADACGVVGEQVEWTARRANLLVDAIWLKDTTGRILRVGEVTLEVTGELEPCSRMDEACPGLCAALRPDWRGGVTCRVINGGRVRIGDPVELVAAGSD